MDTEPLKPIREDEKYRYYDIGGGLQSRIRKEASLRTQEDVRRQARAARQAQLPKTLLGVLTQHPHGISQAQLWAAADCNVEKGKRALARLVAEGRAETQYMASAIICRAV